MADDAKKLAAQREQAAKEEAKRQTARRNQEQKELRAFASEITGVMSTVKTAIGGALGATSVGGFLSAVKSSAAEYSQLQVQAQRTGSTPRGIRAYEFALEQMGVDRGEAEGSLESFSKIYQDNPKAFASMLGGMGIRSQENGRDRDLSAVLGDMGKWFASNPEYLGRNRAQFFGIGMNAYNAMRQQAEMQRHIADYNSKAAGFGVDDNAAAEQGRKFTAAYDNMATDLGFIWTRLKLQFFTPLTEAMSGISSWLEAHPKLMDGLGEGLLAFAALMSARVIPTLVNLAAKITGIEATLAASPILQRLLGLAPGAAVAAAVMAPTPANGDEPQIGPDGTITYFKDGKPIGTSKGRSWDGKSGIGPGGTPLPQTPTPEKPWYQKALDWGKGKLGMGGGDAPGGPVPNSMRERGLAAMRYLVEKKGWTPAAAAISVGNAQQESGITSEGRPGDPNTSGGSHYMYQWNNGKFNDTIKGRRAQYERFAAARGKDPTDFYTSLDYMDEERKHMPGLEDWHTQQDLSDAARISHAYEGYGDNSTATRVQNAANWLRAYQAAGSAAPSAPTANAYTSSDGVMSDEALARYNAARAAFAAGAAPKPLYPLMSGDQPGMERGTSPYAKAMEEFKKSNQDLLTMHRGAMKMAPDGFSPLTMSPQSMLDQRSVNQSRTFTQNVTVNGLQKPDEVASMIKVSARRGGQDYLRYTEGASS